MAHNRLKKLFFKLAEGKDPEKKIQAILDDFYARMSRDTLIGFFFDSRNVSDIAKMQCQFLLFAAGISSTFSGKKPNQAHLGLPPILKGHFDRRLVLLKETLQTHGLSENDIQIWVDFESAFRNQIVDSRDYSKSS